MVSHTSQAASTLPHSRGWPWTPGPPFSTSQMQQLQTYMPACLVTLSFGSSCLSLQVSEITGLSHPAQFIKWSFLNLSDLASGTFLMALAWIPPFRFPFSDLLFHSYDIASSFFCVHLSPKQGCRQRLYHPFLCLCVTLTRCLGNVCGINVFHVWVSLITAPNPPPTSELELWRKGKWYRGKTTEHTEGNIPISAS